MANYNQATSSAALPLNELQAVHDGTATTLLRRSIRLRNKAAAKLTSLQNEAIGGTARSLDQSSLRCKKKNKNTEDSASLSMLPDDLLINVMSRLPPKAFFRCKSVSKSFRTLSMEALHLNKSFQATILCGIFHDTLSWNAEFRVGFAEVLAGASQDVDIRLRFLPCHDNLEMADCCNGLLLVKAWSDSRQTRLYVYNPATYRMLAVWSVPPWKDQGTFYESFSLAFDPRVSSVFCMVCFRGWTYQGVYLNFFQTFSSKTGKWRSQKKLRPDCIIIGGNTSTFVSGKVYRMTTTNKIVSVDPEKDSFQVIQLPNIQNSSRPQIGQSLGFLHFITVVNDALQIWILNSQQEWILKCQLGFNQVFGVPGYGYLNFELLFTDLNTINPVALHPKDNVLFVPSAKGKLISFNFRTFRRREICSLPRTSLLVFRVYMPCYLV